MLLIPARIKQLKDEGREEGRQEAREEMRQRLAQAIARFACTHRGRPVLPFTPEIQRFLNGEEVTPPPPTRRYRRPRPR